METGHLSTRAVNLGSGNRALLVVVSKYSTSLNLRCMVLGSGKTNTLVVVAGTSACSTQALIQPPLKSRSINPCVMMTKSQKLYWNYTHTGLLGIDVCVCVVVLMSCCPNL